MTCSFSCNNYCYDLWASLSDITGVYLPLSHVDHPNLVSVIGRNVVQHFHRPLHCLRRGKIETSDGSLD